jgi:hypothetical protein
MLAGACGEQRDAPVAPAPVAPAPVAPAPAVANLAVPLVAAQGTRPVRATSFVQLRRDGAVAIGVLPPAMISGGAIDLATLGAGAPIAAAELAGQVAGIAGVPDAGLGSDRPPTAGFRPTAALPDLRGTLLPDDGGGALATAAPIVIADRDAPAVRLVEVVRALGGHAALAVSADAGAHARAFEVGFGLDSDDAFDDHSQAQLAVTLTGDRVEMAVIADGRVVPEMFAWKGATGDAAAAYAQARASAGQHDRGDLRLWFGGDATVGQLVALTDALVGAGASMFILGEPRTPGPTGTVGGYGTIRAGTSGAGQRPRAIPSMRISPAEVSGALEANVVRGLIKRDQQRFSYCYERALLGDPSLAGAVATHLVVKADGTVASAEAKGVSDEVAGCLRNALSTLEFPRPKHGTVQVRMSFAFAPTGG